MQYSLTGTEEGSSLTIFNNGEMLPPIHSSHPSFDKIVEGVRAGDESVLELIDLSKAVATEFEPVSERVKVANGRVYFDGVEVHGVLVDQILRFMELGEDYMPLVNFFEKVQQNPQEFSREQLYSWIVNVSDRADRGLTITPEGLIVGYKGVAVVTGDDGEKSYTSISTGTAIVDNEVKSGAIPNYIGAVVEMPRDKVTFDPDQGCSHGLHVGTYDYANGFSRGGLLEVHVNPRDVVSVPNDSSHQKMRVCRYIVADVIDAPYNVPVVRDYESSYDGWGEEEEEDTCPRCGEYSWGGDLCLDCEDYGF
jgi:hypothetical protein